ncbi:MAG: hypothetical protein EPN30_03970 [Actinomycetota bacterium]|nr:MAG: hypothetical protein EPN30_03970 [Actinomycetota bacterium]
MSSLVGPESRKATWIEIGIRNAGFLKAQTALLWAWMWAVTRESLQRDPTVEEVAEWWKESPRTAYREKAAFTKAFPMLESPAKIFDDPVARSKLANLAKLGDEMAANKRARNRVPQSAIIDVGMLSATF